MTDTNKLGPWDRLWHDQADRTPQIRHQPPNVLGVDLPRESRILPVYTRTSYSRSKTGSNLSSSTVICSDPKNDARICPVESSSGFIILFFIIPLSSIDRETLLDYLDILQIHSSDRSTLSDDFGLGPPLLAQLRHPGNCDGGHGYTVSTSSR